VAKIKKAKSYNEPVAFFDHKLPCLKCKCVGCEECKQTGFVPLKWMTNTDKENKIVSFTVNHNFIEREFPVGKGTILQAFQKAEKYFSTLNI
jgi:hypothetical protein